MNLHQSKCCANCDRAIAGPEQKFCPACGQPTPAHRIDWHFLGHELEHSVLHMDRGILYSLKNLMLRPGHLMRDYIEGRRAGHVKPLLLLMIVAAVVVLLGRYALGGDLIGSAMTVTGEEDMKTNADKRFDVVFMIQTFTAVKGWMNEHFAAVSLALVPLEAAAFKISFRRVGNLNYPEWLVITAFLTAQALVLWAILLTLMRWFPQAQIWMWLVAIVYNLFSLVQFFAGYPRWKSALRGILGFGIYFLINGALTLGLVAVLVVISYRG